MKGLKCNRQEAETVYIYDKALETDKRAEFDLPPEKEEIARKMTHTGTRDKKSPMIPNLTPRARKPNATKEGLVEELFKCLANHGEFDIKNLQIANKNSKVSFMIGDKWYTWTLTEHRKKPSGLAEGGKE